jgi:hypothetical protein
MAKIEILKTGFANGSRIRPGIYDELPEGYDPKGPGAYREVNDDGTPISETEQKKDSAPLTTKGKSTKEPVKL